MSSMMIDEDIDEIIRKGEEKTAELNSKYADLDLDALNNFKSESMVNQWEGEDYTGKVRVKSTLSSSPKREYHLR
jgi:SWI/SNF-related matrix-associated actin-dependent regulator of chromatin subfamily A member 5